jgi:hypothetical protein
MNIGIEKMVSFVDANKARRMVNAMFDSMKGAFTLQFAVTDTVKLVEILGDIEAVTGCSKERFADMRTDQFKELHEHLGKGWHFSEVTIKGKVLNAFCYKLNSNDYRAIVFDAEKK